MSKYKQLPNTNVNLPQLIEAAEQIHNRFKQRQSDRTLTGNRVDADISNDLDQLAENNRLAGETYQTGTQSSQLIEAADQRRRAARAEESRAQVQQKIDIRQSEERLAGAQNDPSQPRGSYVDIRA